MQAARQINSKTHTKASQKKEEQEQWVDNYIQLQHIAFNMHYQIDNLTHIPLGFNVNKCKRQAMSMLSSSGGAQKKCIQQTRYR